MKVSKSRLNAEHVDVDEMEVGSLMVSKPINLSRLCLSESS